MFKKAERKNAKLRMGIVGAAGSGKTYSSLLVAQGLGEKIAVIDTENGSAELYSNVCDYDVCTITAPYTAQKYITAIKEAERLGYDVVIIDSLSHAWSGEGGLLDAQGKIADSGKNSFAAWRTITPQHNKLVESMLQSNCHIIATMRAKTEYILQEETNSKGYKTVTPKKIGMAPVQRDGMDYEFTVVFDIDSNHNATASKDRTTIFDGTISVITKEHGETLKNWLESGKEVIEEPEQKKPASKFHEVKGDKPAEKPADMKSDLAKRFYALCNEKCIEDDLQKEIVLQMFDKHSRTELTEKELKQLIEHIVPRGKEWLITFSDIARITKAKFPHIRSASALMFHLKGTEELNTSSILEVGTESLMGYCERIKGAS